MITEKESTLGGEMDLSNHCEADFCMVLFVLRAIDEGHKRSMIRTGDTSPSHDRTTSTWCREWKRIRVRILGSEHGCRLRCPIKKVGTVYLS